MNTQTIRSERIDIRLTPEEKKIFLKALRISGERSLSAFVTRIVKYTAIEMITEKEKVLAGKLDRKVFFDAIFADTEPNKALKAAAKKYKTAQNKSF